MEEEYEEDVFANDNIKYVLTRKELEHLAYLAIRYSYGLYPYPALEAVEDFLKDKEIYTGDK